MNIILFYLYDLIVLTVSEENAIKHFKSLGKGFHIFQKFCLKTTRFLIMGILLMFSQINIYFLNVRMSFHQNKLKGRKDAKVKEWHVEHLLLVCDFYYVLVILFIIRSNKFVYCFSCKNTFKNIAFISKMVYQFYIIMYHIL